MFLKNLLRKTLFLSILVVIPVFSCRNSNLDNDSKTVTIAILNFPTEFDPRTAQRISDRTVLANLYEGLLKEREDNYSLEYALAESVHISEDNLIYTFKLKDTYWSNGDPVTSTDFKESWLQLLSPDFPAVSPKILDCIKNARKTGKGIPITESVGIYDPDPHTLRIELERPYSCFLKLTTTPVLFPVHKNIRHSYLTGKKTGTGDVISSGPFRIEESSSDKILLLKKNNYYYDKRLVRLEALKFLLIPSSHTAYLMFRNKTIDWFGQPFTVIHNEALDELKKNQNLLKFDVVGTTWLLSNHTSGPLSNKKFRQALSLSIDRENIVKGVLRAHQLPTSKILPPSFHSSSQYLTEKTDYNTAKAKQLFKEAIEEMGVRPQNCRFKLSYSTTTPRYALLAQVLCENWQSVLGLEISPQGFDKKTVNSLMEDKKFDMIIDCRIPAINDAVNFLEIFESYKRFYFLILEKEKFTKLLMRIRKENNYYEKSILLRQVEKFFEEESTIIPIYSISFDFAVNPRLTGFRNCLSGSVDFKTAEVK